MLKKIIETDGFNSVVKGKYGYIAYNKNDKYVGKAVGKYGEYSEAEVELFNQICGQDDIIIEVGANIGAHTVALSQIVGEKGRIYAFEVQRIIFQTLCANLALNSLTNVECFNMAVSSEEGFVLMPDFKYDLELNFGCVRANQFSKGLRVPMITLDNFLNLPTLKLIKIDVEGMEFEVISGAKTIIQNCKPILYVENGIKEKSKDLIDLIKSLSYRLFWHFPPFFNPHNFATDPENIYGGNIYQGLVSTNMLCIHNTENIDIEGLREIDDSNYYPFI